MAVDTAREMRLTVQTAAANCGGKLSRAANCGGELSCVANCGGELCRAWACCGAGLVYVHNTDALL